MKYGDKLVKMRGIIVHISDGSVAMDLKGRLGHLTVPMRMLITDYDLKIGQEVAFNISFPEVMSGEVNEKYVSNIKKNNRGGK